MNVNRKLAAQCLGILLALPILYIASSGPALHYLSAGSERQRKLGLSLYRPLIESARAMPWEDSLHRYFVFWRVFPMHAGHDNHLFIIVLTSSDKNKTPPGKETYPEDQLTPGKRESSP